MKIFISSKFLVYICIKQHFRQKTRNVTGEVSDKMFLSLKRKFSSAILNSLILLAFLIFCYLGKQVN